MTEPHGANHRGGLGRGHLGSVVGASILGIAALCVVLPAAPPLHPVPYRDSGVFLYMGGRILEGAVPYVDVWDHKPPMIHFINAAGLLIGRGSFWGIWLVQAGFLLAAVLIGFHAFGSRMSTTAAFLATASWLSGVPFVLQMGNFAEEYALVFQMATMAVFFRLIEDDEPVPLRLMALGALGAALLLLKPNLAGLPTVATAIIVVGFARRRRWSTALGSVGFILLGGLMVFLPILGWFGLRGGLEDLVDAVWRYNIAYSATTPGKQMAALRMGIGLTMTPGLAVLAMGGWIFALAGLMGFGPGTRWPHRPFLWFVIVALPVEFGLASMSGREYPHYFLSVLPICGALTALLLYLLKVSFRTNGQQHRALNALIALAVVGVSGFVGGREIYRQLLYSGPDLRTQKVVLYVEENSAPDDTVLVWGAETTVNVLSRRQAPTRFVYQYPLFTSGYQREAFVDELLADLANRPPRLVVDASATNPIIPPLSVERPTDLEPPPPGYEVPPSVDRIRHWIDDRYRVLAIIDGWRVLGPNR